MSAQKKTWTQPRAPDGQPDFTGYWTNATYTPLERDRDLGTTKFFTPAEAGAYAKKREQPVEGRHPLRQRHLAKREVRKVVDGSKDIESTAGDVRIAVCKLDDYGKVDASVKVGDLSPGPFGGSKKEGFISQSVNWSARASTRCAPALVPAI